MAKSNLPIEVHDHFRKANVLHGYVLKDLGEATKHALEAGQELLAAKKSVPHGSWEKECERLFDGSVRTAQFYMQFTRNIQALPKAQQYGVLYLESTLEGAAKVAKRLADGEPPYKETPPEPEPEVEDEPEPEEEQDDEHPEPPAPSKPEPKEIVAKTGREKEVWDAGIQVKVWADTVGRWMSGHPSIDEYRDKFPGKAGDRVIEAAKELWTALDAWKKGLK